jgi:hypothetical protein
VCLFVVLVFDWCSLVYVFGVRCSSLGTCSSVGRRIADGGKPSCLFLLCFRGACFPQRGSIVSAQLFLWLFVCLSCLVLLGCVCWLLCFACLFVCVFVCLFVCLLVCLFVRLAALRFLFVGVCVWCSL